MDRNTQLIKEIWHYSGGTYGSFAEIDRYKGGYFSERFHVRREVDAIPRQIVGVDQYFSALTFFEQRRSNDTTVGPGLLFADLDAVDPHDLAIKPSAAWETSPGSYQAVWWLTASIGEYGEWADLNRRMTYHVGADRGGWMGSKLLRVPGSYNFKRATPGGVPKGNLLWHTNNQFDARDLEKALDPLKNRQENSSSTEHPALLEPREREWLVRALWPQIGLRGRYMLSKALVPDRSLHIVQTINELNNGRLTPENVFQLIWVQPWCKWRPDKPETLWAEVCRVMC